MLYLILSTQFSVSKLTILMIYKLKKIHAIYFFLPLRDRKMQRQMSLLMCLDYHFSEKEFFMITTQDLMRLSVKLLLHTGLISSGLGKINHW